MELCLRLKLVSVQSGYWEYYDIVIASFDYLSYELLRSKNLAYPYTRTKIHSFGAVEAILTLLSHMVRISTTTTWTPYIHISFKLFLCRVVYLSGMVIWKARNCLFGFIESLVVCPRTIKRPFLPYRDQNNTWLFPTGKFVGVYYSEELKYARDLGYRIIPLRGYLFEKKHSPFDCLIPLREQTIS